MNDDTLIRIAELSKKVISEEEFLHKFNVPCLLHKQSSQQLTPAFRTGYTEAGVGDEDIEGVEVAFLVRKRPDGPFPERISVGRTRVSDVKLPYPQVSKLHAYFTIDGSTYMLTDAHATNGTYVNGIRLLANTPVAVPPASLIRFGIHLFTFLLPEQLFEYVSTWTPP